MNPLEPDRHAFSRDPFGYSSLAWFQLAAVAALEGVQIDPRKPPSAEDLKNPVLWVTQASAMVEAAMHLLRHVPDYKLVLPKLRGVADTQYCAVTLMIVGYSLETALKAMIILRSGVEAYKAAEKGYRHHRLHDLADFVPGLSVKDKAILEGLTHFVYWAGRYPDPGSGRLGDAERIQELSARHAITASDLFDVAGRILNHLQAVVKEP